MQLSFLHATLNASSIRQVSTYILTTDLSPKRVIYVSKTEVIVLVFLFFLLLALFPPSPLFLVILSYARRPNAFIILNKIDRNHRLLFVKPTDTILLTYLNAFSTYIPFSNSIVFSKHTTSFLRRTSIFIFCGSCTRNYLNRKA